jgi:hypothetical protein
MENIGKVLFWLGLALVALGCVVWLLGRAGFRGLPGDIRYETGHVRVYFPIVTSVVLSVILTLGLWLWQWLKK